MILSLKQQLATARPAQLASISAAVGAALAQAMVTARLAQQAVSDGANNQSLTSARQAAREAVNDFEDAYFKERKFEPYLRFASEDDEREFRQREAERQADIEQARAKGTPEGELRAAQLSKAQLLDAGAHGADKSPDYQATMAKLNRGADELEAAMEANKTVAPSAAPQTEVDKVVAAEQTARFRLASVPADVLARIKAAGIVAADNGSGHGLGERSDQPTAVRQL